MPISRNTLKVAGRERGSAFKWSSASNSSMTSPTVMSMSLPPLAAMMTAQRRDMWPSSTVVSAGSASQARCRRAKPSRSRARTVAKPSRWPFPPVSSQRTEGRTTPVPTRACRAPVMYLARAPATPWRSSHSAGPAAQSLPAASAPLASQRSCQVLPGWSSSQSSRNWRPPRLTS